MHYFLQWVHNKKSHRRFGVFFLLLLIAELQVGLFCFVWGLFILIWGLTELILNEPYCGGLIWSPYSRQNSHASFLLVWSHELFNFIADVCLSQKYNYYLFSYEVFTEDRPVKCIYQVGLWALSVSSFLLISDQGKMLFLLNILSQHSELEIYLQRKIN